MLMKKYIVLCFIVTLTITVGFSQSRSERKKAKKEKLEADYKQTKALIESGSFQFVATWANPLGNDISTISSKLPNGGAGVFQGNRVNLSSNPNFIKIDGKTADIIMPYFGRVFRASPGSASTGGIEFKGDVDDYRVDYNDKKYRIDIRFESKSKIDTIDYQFTVNSGGDAILTLSSINRQITNYDGSITALEIKKE